MVSRSPRLQLRPPTFNDANFEFQAPGVNNNQNDTEQQVDNVFRYDVGMVAVRGARAPVLVAKTP